MTRSHHHHHSSGHHHSPPRPSPELSNHQNTTNPSLSPSAQHSAEDVSWSVVCPTLSTPPTSTPCVTTSGSQLTPRTVIIEECPTQEGDDEVIIASSVEEPLDEEDNKPRNDDSINGVIDLTKKPITSDIPSNSSISLFTNPRVSTSLSEGSAAAIHQTSPPSLLKQHPVGLQRLRQHLLFNRSSTIASISPTQDSTGILSRDQSLERHRSQSHRSSPSSPFSDRQATETVTAIGASESIAITDAGAAAVRRQDKVQHSKTISVNHQGSNQQQQRTSTTSTTQFVSYATHPPNQSSTPHPSSSVFPSSLPSPTHQSNPYFPGLPVDNPSPYIVMQQQHSASQQGPFPFHHSNTVPAQHQSSYSSDPSTSLSERDPTTQQVARPAYGSVAPPPTHRDYATDMTRVASAAYTKAMNDAARIQMMTAAQFASRAPQQPIIIQNTTKAVAESQNESRTTAGPPPRRSILDRWTDLFQDFWSSKLNRLLVIGLTGAGLYLYWEWWTHHRRMQLMQRRIDANPLLRLGHMLSGVTEGQRSRINSASSSYYYT